MRECVYYVSFAAPMMRADLERMIKERIVGAQVSYCEETGNHANCGNFTIKVRNDEKADVYLEMIDRLIQNDTYFSRLFRKVH